MNVRPASDLLRHVEETIRARGLLRDGQRVLLAVSGGLDSVVLLEVLHSLAPPHRWSLVVAHFNHQLRGSASAADERFVRALARSRRLPFVAGRWARREQHRTKGCGLEMAARLARHEFLARAASGHRCPVVALAHHADDQVELGFLRLLRGAGGEGLSGMKWAGRGWAGVGLTLVRPLLDRSRSDLAAFARAEGLRHREDASNRDLDRDRNWVRHELIPRIRRRFGPAPLVTVLRTMELVGTEADFTQGIAEHWLGARDQVPFARLHPAVQRHVLRLQLHRLEASADFDLVEWLRKRPNQPVTTEGGREWMRDSDGRVVHRDSTKVGFNSSELRLRLAAPGSRTFDGVRLRWRLLPAAGAQRALERGRAGRELFDATAIGRAIRVRHWRPGDRFQPIGLPRPAKLQDLFTNLKIPAARRRALLVAEADDGQVFWVEGVRIGERFKITPGTRRMLEWRWQRTLEASSRSARRIRAG